MGKSSRLKKGRHAAPGVSRFDRDGLAPGGSLGAAQSSESQVRDEGLHRLVLVDVDTAALLPLQQNDTVTFLYSDREVLVLGKNRRLGRVQSKDENAVRSDAPAQRFLIHKNLRSDAATVAYLRQR